MPRRKKIIIKHKKNASGTKRHTRLSQYGLRNCCIIIRDQSKTTKKPDTKSISSSEKGDGKIKLPLVKMPVSNKKRMDYGPRSDGLSPREKSYIICSCQAKLNRYKSLKLQASRAIQENKIFSLYGYCNGIRSALLERGWVEKLPMEKMNLSRIRNGICTSKVEVLAELEKLFLSNLVEKHPPNFIWRTKDVPREAVLDMSDKDCPLIINRLKTDALWASKQGLCSSMKRNYWFYIEDEAEVMGPRSYATSDSREMEGFTKDYKITACTSLLKWILSMVANERKVFVEKGKISVNVILFALCRCKEYLYRKEHKDIDQTVSDASDDQWNCFLKKYYRIIGKDDVFEIDKENKLPLYMAYAKFLLKQMHRYRPQLSCEGCHNIWIIKPAHNSRGRGIRLASKLTVINDLLNKANDKYVIQKYIEEPLLIHETKFDIRQYCLVTSTYPLVIWMYRDCYLKFSSQKYNLKNYHESIHLTNNAVQRKYKNCTGRHQDLPTSNMWDSAKYKDYLVRLDKGKVWDKIIYPGMKKCIIGIMLTCQDSLPVSKNRFELYGCDFILDKEYKPWLIEINSSPDLNPTTPVTAKLCPNVLSDIIKVVIDHVENPSSSTGRFECVYQQPMSMPRYGPALDLYVRGVTLPNEYFYKGDIDLRESYDIDEDSLKGNNIKAILDKIKHTYDTHPDTDTIMREPENDDEVVLKQDRGVNPRLRDSQTDNELNMAVSVVTAQLDDLLHRVGSRHKKEKGTNLKSKRNSEFKYENFDEVDTRSVQTHSETEFTIMLDKSLKKFISAGTMNTFDFSELNDGPGGKGSTMAVNNTKKIFNDIKKLIEGRLIKKLTTKENTSFSTDFMLDATTELINFISKKEQEYSSEAWPE
ncbi:hypothetical protein PYW07_000862 [Mythimna separata]|uniref:Tubulin glycylase 3A-like n=1 Tax=Mythimna separata TaxID=271217 RepID=A0AAD7YSP2_MYTSE|nr:hypothetical protein PYW07_000862 [Mythimna separata]